MQSPATSFVYGFKFNKEGVTMTKDINYHGVGQILASTLLVVWTLFTTSFFVEGVPVEDCNLP